MATRTQPTVADIEAARERLEGVARVTPVYSSETFSRMCGRPVWLKAENLQRTGSFKIRGAVNKVATLGPEERAAGVVTASAGNHGQAVAWAAREAGVKATIYMPEDAPMAKVEATKSYGAEIVLAGEGFDEAVVAAHEREEAGATFVHAFEDEVVIAGQGTIGLELAEQLEESRVVVVPIGGGGLAAGTAIALRARRPEIRLVGVQAAACAPVAGSDRMGFTIADGIAVKHPGELTQGILDDLLDDIVTVTDDEIAEAIVLLVERVKLVVEGAGAASVAALLAGRVGGGEPACALLSGGNIDASLLMEVGRYGLTRAGRYLVLRTYVRDRPGALARLLTRIAEERVNVVSVEHHREGMDIPLAETEVELTLGTRDEAHCEELLERLSEWGYAVERLR
ncbi:MAG TPA: threonine ammonia-lyase [Gaiellaceae bacterium]|jgi:threonine dehydratase|nr:threonine ammonia-lyase [Gaiellaceae bacterium]